MERVQEIRAKGFASMYDAPESGSYAESRLKQLKEEREKYNVNDLHYYNGGLPQKHGYARGKAWSIPGDIHDTAMHNEFNFNHPDSTFVSADDEIKFKSWMNSDKQEFQEARPYYTTTYDRNFNFLRDRSFFLLLLLSMMGGTFVFKRYNVEVERRNRTIRMGHLENLPAHHFSNRGGVVIEKQFLGFEKYHQSTEALVNWYHKAYPAVFK